jgi:hypothetical protein
MNFVVRNAAALATAGADELLQMQQSPQLPPSPPPLRWDKIFSPFTAGAAHA